MISSSCRKLSGYRRYQRTRRTMISASKCRPLNSAGRFRFMQPKRIKCPERCCNTTTKIDNLCYRRYGRGKEGLSMNVSLTPELEKFVSARVGSGRYNSASEVVREALWLLEEHEPARAAQLAEFNEELSRRLASLERGENVDPAEARVRLQRKSAECRKLQA